MLKEQCAQQNAACSGSKQSGQSVGSAEDSTAKNGLEMATWQTARQYLRDILNESARTSDDKLGVVPLSNVKRLFRSKFHTELSETKLGHSKLSDLLQDARFKDICSVQLQSHGYIVKQTPPEEAPAISLATALADHVPKQECSNLDGLVQRTFIHAALPPPTPPPNARRRSASVPKDSGSNQSKLLALAPLLAGEQRVDTDSTEDSTSAGDSNEPSQSFQLSRRSSLDDPVKVLLKECNLGASMEMPDQDAESNDRLQFCPNEPLALDMLEEGGFSLESALITQTPFSPFAPRWPCVGPPVLNLEEKLTSAEDASASNRLKFCPDEPLALDDFGQFVDSAPITETPCTPSFPRWPPLPPLDAGTVPGCVPVSANHPEPRSLSFCPDEPLELEEAGLFVDEAAPKKMLHCQSPWSSCSPSSLVRRCRVGSVALTKVHNTFIHSPMPPPTPQPGASKRSRSLPKNVGSDKNAWEAACQALGCSQLPADQRPAAVCANVSTPGARPSLPPTPAGVRVSVPPSPDFPTYCNMHQLDAAQRLPLFAQPAMPFVPMYGWAPYHGMMPNVISLADLQQAPSTDSNVISLSSLLS